MQMTNDEKYMSRCIELARMGKGNVSPNPMVGCIIVYNGQIIGEGYHQKYGEPHAEVNAINSVQSQELLEKSTIYVSLEPCAHFGLTPPCSDLIVSKKIPHVVIGSIDPFAKVAGKGIEKLKNAGCKVKVGVLQKECDELNKRFFTFHSQKRPFVILKWAQTSDGFIDIDRSAKEYGEPTWITGPEALVKVHEQRAEEDSILVGTNTAEKDNPSLTVRHCEGENPFRLVLDRNLRLPENLNLFDGSTPTLVLNSIKNGISHNIEFKKIDFSQNLIPQLLECLYEKKRLSLIVEGGKQLLDSFIEGNFWDEAHIYSGNKKFVAGIPAPKIEGTLVRKEDIKADTLEIYQNTRVL